MRFIAIVICALLIVGCATRNTPCEIEDATGRMGQQATVSPNQDTKKWDVFTGAAVADSDGDALQNNTKTGVDVQSPTQATAGTIQFSFLPDATKILSHTTPGEAATLRRLESLEQEMAAYADTLANDPTLSSERRLWVENALATTKANYERERDRLDQYSEAKWKKAESFVPDLGALKQILFNVQQVTVAGNEKPNISDAQAESIARVAEKGVESSPLPSTTVVEVMAEPTPAPEGGGGE